MRDEDISTDEFLSLSKYDESYNYIDIPRNSKGIKLLITSIAVVVILAIIIMLITIIGLIKLQNTKNRPSGSVMNPNVNSYSDPKQTSTVSAIYDVGNGGISGDPPCTSYTVINDPSRSVTAPGFGGTCDNGPLFNTSIGGRWIRFTGSGGTMIPLESPGYQHCSAYSPGWFNGTLPTVTGIILNGEVCFDLYKNICLFYVHVSVIKCSDFYVYFLPSANACNARYCTI